MKKILLFLLAVIVVVGLFFVIYQVKTFSGTQQAATSNKISAKTISTYQENCLRCHGKKGQGYDIKPELQNISYSIEEIKNIVRAGLDEMPAFPTIKDPVLTELAEYISDF